MDTVIKVHLNVVKHSPPLVFQRQKNKRCVKTVDPSDGGHRVRQKILNGIRLTFVFKKKKKKPQFERL